MPEEQPLIMVQLTGSQQARLLDTIARDLEYMVSLGARNSPGHAELQAIARAVHNGI